MRAVVVGAGAVGGRAARQILSTTRVDELALVETRPEQASAVAASLSGPTRHVPSLGMALDSGAEVVVLAVPGPHRGMAEDALEAGAHVVSCADDLDNVRALLDLDPEARERGLHLAVGAGFSPGMACVLASHAAASFDAVDEIHLARAGTGGPACARQHHRALGQSALDWREGGWLRRPGGSGRELCWFPDPVRSADCYRAGLPETMLIVDAFPSVRRVTARLAANRRDRMTGRLPMMRRPHPEGTLGAVRVEVRGRRGAARDERVLGAVERPAAAAASVAALVAQWALEGRLARHGAAGLAVLVEPIPFLSALAETGIRAAVFHGDDDQPAA